MHDLLRWIRRIGRPDAVVDVRVRVNDREQDERLKDMEKRQHDIAARLRLLEKAADPRGRFTDES